MSFPTKIVKCTRKQRQCFSEHLCAFVRRWTGKEKPARKCAAAEQRSLGCTAWACVPAWPPPAASLFGHVWWWHAPSCSASIRGWRPQCGPVSHWPCWCHKHPSWRLHRESSFMGHGRRSWAIASCACCLPFLSLSALWFCELPASQACWQVLWSIVLAVPSHECNFFEWREAPSPWSSKLCSIAHFWERCWSLPQRPAGSCWVCTDQARHTQQSAVVWSGSFCCNPE